MGHTSEIICLSDICLAFIHLKLFIPVLWTIHCIFIFLGKSLVVRRKFTYWLTEILWSLIFRHYCDFGSLSMSRRVVIDYHKACQSLIKWMKTKIPNCRISNVTTDLHNGVVFCQLINAIVPNSANLPLLEGKVRAEETVSYALEVAKEVLGIPVLINAKDIANCKADEKGLITYVALFRSADRMLARGIRPVSPRTSEKSFCHGYEDKRDQHRNFAYGFGIRHGEVGKPTEFILHLDEDAESDVHISIKCTPDDEDETRVKAEPKLKPIGDCGYIISYTPVIAGFYEISVLCGKKHITNSPFKIQVEKPDIAFKRYSKLDQNNSVEPAKETRSSDYLFFSDDPRSYSNWTELDGIPNNIPPNRPESLNTVDSGIENVLYSESLTNSYLSVTENSERGSSLTTIPSSPNGYSKGDSESSAFSDFDFFEATGSGLDSGEVGVMSQFEVRTPNGSNGPLSVFVTCPAVSIPTPNVNTRPDGDQLIHDVMFLPTEPGTYEIELKWGNKLIAGSPYAAVITEAYSNETAEPYTKDFDSFLNEPLMNEKEAVLYYSATSADVRHTRRCQYLESLLCTVITNLKLDKVAMDLEIPADERRQLFARINGNVKLPFVFLNKKFLGTFETLIGLYRRGILREFINREFDYLRTDNESNELLDFKTLHEIKRTLKELRTPMLS